MAIPSILRSLPILVPEPLGDCHGPTALAMTCSFLEKMPLSGIREGQNVM